MSVQAHWFRLYHDVLRDTKFDLPWWGDRQFWIWTGLLLLASESSRRGTVTFYMSKMDAMDQLKKTLRSGLSRDEIVTCVTHLEKTGCLKTLCSNPGRTVLQVCHWKRRQTYKPSDSPDNAAERQRRHREKATASGDVTPSSRVTSRPVTPNVTPPRTEQNRTEQNRADQRGVTTANGSGVFSSQGDGPGGNGKGGEPAAVHLDHIRQLKANPAKWDALPEHTRAKYERTIAEAEGGSPVTDEIRRCPRCQSPMVLKSGRRGQFLGCEAWPSCQHTEPYRGGTTAAGGADLRFGPRHPTMAGRSARTRTFGEFRQALDDHIAAEEQASKP